MPTLDDLRDQIDDIDEKIIHLLADRARIVHEVGKLKNSDEEILAEARQEEIYRTRGAWAAARGLDPDFVTKLYKLIVNHFIEVERKQLAERIKNDGA